MPFDGIVAAAISRELNEKIVGARVEKIYQPGRDTVVLTLHSQGEKLRLLLCAQAERARLHLTGQNLANPLNPPTFCMVLRKHLEGGRVISVTQTGLERVITIEIESPDDYGRPTIKGLVTEVMGRHSNIILTNLQTGAILDGIKRYSHAVSRYREVFPSRSYLPPPPQDKADPLEVSEDEWRDLILKGGQSHTTAPSPASSPAAKLLVSLFHGLSPLIARELLYRAGLDEHTSPESWGDYEYNKLWQVWQEVFSGIRRGEFEPTMILNGRGESLAFAGIDLSLYEGTRHIHLSMSEVMDRYFEQKAGLAAFEEKFRRLQNIAGQARENCCKKIALQEEALAEADEGDTWRMWGDLMMANLYRLAAGEKEAILANIFEPEAPEVSIPLDPSLTPSQNAQRYYKKYNRARNTIEKASEIKSGLAEELAYLDSILAHLAMAATLADLAEIEEELAAAGYIKKKPVKGGKQKAPAPQPARFTSSEGYTILAGRNNRQNDYLTMRLAQPEDIWLHVKDMPGSHVLIKDAGAEVPDASLEEAAIVAAWHSQGRTSSKVAVDYTRRKNVWKPRGAKPGFVLYENQRTVVVTPDEGKIQILLEDNIKIEDKDEVQD